MNEDLSTPTEAAARLRVSKRTIYRLIDDGTFRAIRVGGQLRLLTADVDSLIADQLEETAPEPAA